MNNEMIGGKNQMYKIKSNLRMLLLKTIHELKDPIKLTESVFT